MSKLINDFRPDIVQVGPVTHPGWEVIRVWDGPLVATSWGFDLLHDIDQDRDLEGKARAVLERADLLFVDNNASAKRAIALGADASSITQFPWGIDDRWFVPRDKLVLGEASEITVLCTRRHERIYRVADVVAAFIAAAAIRDNLRLKLVGSGSLTCDLKAQAAASGLGNRIEFLGEVDNISLPAMYRGADIYVSTSEVDGTSVSLLEAMASGMVILASLNAGNIQWVTEETGFGFPVGDTESLVASLLRLASNMPEVVLKARERAANATSIVKAQARWGSIARRFPMYAEQAIARWMSA